MVVKDYHIEMLDVADADAFIVFVSIEIFCELQEKLILVDAGRYSDGDKIAKHLKKYYPGKCVDLAIVSHCDVDHYGGFIRLLELMHEGKNNAVQIRKFLINDPRTLTLSQEDFEALKCHCADKDRLKQIFEDKKKNLLDMIDALKIERNNAFAITTGKGNFQIAIETKLPMPFDFISILGPTENYYRSLVPHMRKIGLKVINESYSSIGDLYTLDENVLLEGVDRKEKDSSSNNLSSIIFLMNLLGKKYLFTGDAGEKSFENMTDKHYAAMADVFWLKVPHHGSDRNLSRNVIQHMNPQIAYISTKEEGRYLNQNTVDALKDVGCRVYSTHLHKKNFIHNGLHKRPGYKKAQPL